MGYYPALPASAKPAFISMERGVSAAMLNRLETEEYLKKQYQLAAIPAIIDKDSLAVLSANLTAFTTEDILYTPSDSISQTDHELNPSENAVEEKHTDSNSDSDNHSEHR